MDFMDTSIFFAFFTGWSPPMMSCQGANERVATFGALRVGGNVLGHARPWALSNVGLRPAENETKPFKSEKLYDESC